MVSPHKFHIPVMGLAYTVDSPIKVARFGISSVVSIVEDRLIELMRRHYYPYVNQPYQPITHKEDDYRAKRITDYLNLVNQIVNQQVAQMKLQAFGTGSELDKNFELLPSDSSLRSTYFNMLAEQDEQEKLRLDQWLRTQVVPGAIDVNIMTKVDRTITDASGVAVENGSDALTALKGYVKSNLTNSSIIFSAGLNPRLFNYLESFRELDAKAYGQFDKKVVVKVSDYRSALIQGKYLAKKGIWVSEFRVESGLNCGGHAFATDGILLGPIMQEFADKKEELAAALFALYQPAIAAKGGLVFDKPHPIALTVQGGIGTFEEAEFLLQQYGAERTGWGSPFLLCPEATTVETDTLALLCEASEEDIVLSHNSPLGVRFHYLKGTSAEQEKQTRVALGKPGSPCTEKHLVSNTEFSSEPICTASRKYQELKLEQLKGLNLSATDLQKQEKAVLDKECLCVGLINSAVKAYQLPSLKHQEAVTICPGPNTAYFNREVSLQEMVDHIYGRINILANTVRPHMFIKEIYLYIDYLKEMIGESVAEASAKPAKQVASFYHNLQQGINYYKQLTGAIGGQLQQHQDAFSHALENAKARLDRVMDSLQPAQPVVAGV